MSTPGDRLDAALDEALAKVEQLTTQLIAALDELRTSIAQRRGGGSE